MDSRYIRIRKSHWPKRKRVRKLYGAFEDSGKWFKCWNCGFICTTDRNIGHTGYNESEAYTEDAPLTDERMVMTGKTYDSYSRYKTNNTKGCPMCGATNIF